ncbi:A mating type protein [Serpula lacrymans var. lacrymans S7.9]|uniref:A mating type protein n=1 Tax=Serpula lacrymans var. lacrymans (strain S7.9) TaxID=578457 RepID=F8NG87_SERL9|nr:A mating type protein [Serpula lacrymans var. lacrymans S7.9]EGO31057.1 A mating type protein [Serpula lacrymans var. lacrymans S7.9]
MDLTTRLLQVEDDFLSAIEDGPQAVEKFDREWSSLCADVEQAIHLRTASSETIELASALSARMAVLVESFVDLQNASDEATANLTKQWDHIFLASDDNRSLSTSLTAHLHIQHHESLAHKSHFPHPHVELCDSPGLPPFIAPAYKWLLKNLHDPYPSKEVKQSISHSSGTPTDNVSAWFTNIRRRMGWTALSRTYFHNCRADTLDAAYRVFVQEDPKRQLDPQITHAFMVVKVTAEGLYSAKFKRSALAGQLDVVVKDMTDEDRLRMENVKFQGAEEERKRKEVEKGRRRQERARQRELSKAARSASKSYPSPIGSPYGSPVPALEDSLADESENEEDHVALPKILAGNKRHVSPATLTPSRHVEHPHKKDRHVSLRSGSPRLHLHSLVRLDLEVPEIMARSSIPSLPSPPSEVDTNHGVFDYWSPEVVELPVSLNAPAPVQSHNRKRRLSDGAAQGAPKRPRGLVGPRLYAVSDPLPRANESADDFNAWLMSNFEIPPAVADEVPDPSTLLDVDVECYNWSSMQDCYKLPVDETTMLASPPYSTQLYNPFNVDPNPFSTTDINPFSTSDNLDELYQNIFGPNSHHPPPYSSQPVDDATSSLTCVTSDSTTSAPPSMSFSDDLFSDGGVWSHLPSYTDAVGSLNYSSTHSSVPESTDPLNLSSILSEIDISILQLPTSSPPKTSCLNEGAARLADKQAKLEQLRMLEEAKRRLEAELASDV